MTPGGDRGSLGLHQRAYGDFSLRGVDPGPLSDYGPFGHSHRRYGEGSDRADQTVNILGASINAEAGNVGTDTELSGTSDYGPFGYVSRVRTFSKVGGDVFVSITGAQIVGQAAHPDISDVTIYVDTGLILGEPGFPTADAAGDEPVFITGAAIAGEAGTVTSTVDIVAPITGAAIAAEAGTVDGIGDTDTGTDANVTIVGAGMAGEAGTVAAAHDFAVSVTGAQIYAQASEIGLDTNFDVSVTVTGMAIDLEAGTVTKSDTPGVELPDTSSPAGGWGQVYDHYFSSKKQREDERKSKMQAISKLEARDREIARLLHKQMEYDERTQEIAKLDALIQSLDVKMEARRLEREVSEAASAAFIRAYMQANFSALEAFEREMDLAREEEEFLLLALAMTILR